MVAAITAGCELFLMAVVLLLLGLIVILVWGLVVGLLSAGKSMLIRSKDGMNGQKSKAA